MNQKMRKTLSVEQRESVNQSSEINTTVNSLKESGWVKISDAFDYVLKARLKTANDKLESDISGEERKRAETLLDAIPCITKTSKQMNALYIHPHEGVVALLDCVGKRVRKGKDIQEFLMMVGEEFVKLWIAIENLELTRTLLQSQCYDQSLNTGLYRYLNGCGSSNNPGVKRIFKQKEDMLYMLHRQVSQNPNIPNFVKDRYINKVIENEFLIRLEKVGKNLAKIRQDKSGQSDPLKKPECFISFSMEWDVNYRAIKIDQYLTTAGVGTLFAFRDLLVGHSVHDFESKLQRSEFVVMLATPLYAKKGLSDQGNGTKREFTYLQNRFSDSNNRNHTIGLILKGSDTKECLPDLYQPGLWLPMQDQSDTYTSIFRLLAAIYTPSDRSSCDQDIQEFEAYCDDMRTGGLTDEQFQQIHERQLAYEAGQEENKRKRANDSVQRFLNAKKR